MTDRPSTASTPSPRILDDPVEHEPQPSTPSPDEWERTGHGSIKRHYPRTADALRGFLGQGVTTTVCDGCGVPMTLANGKWRADSPSPEGADLADHPGNFDGYRGNRLVTEPSPEGARTDDHDPDYPGHDPDCPMHSPEGADRGHVHRPANEPAEHFCERCGGPNLMCWHAPSPLWNAVMRDADGLETYGVVCPRCFGELAQEKGVADFFCVTTHDPKVELASVFGDGRVWDAEQCLWVEREAALPEPSAHGLDPGDGSSWDRYDIEADERLAALPESSLDPLLLAVKDVIEVRAQQFTDDGLGKQRDEIGNRANHSRWLHRFYVALDEMEVEYARLGTGETE